MTEQVAAPKRNAAALIYIGGYGRSGSTLLEALLTSRPDVLACGEVISCLRTRPDRGCSCGKPRNKCPVWGPIYSGTDGNLNVSHTDLTLALLEQAKCDYSFVVDSSKTAWGALSAPFRSRRACRNYFRLLHVVRDPRAVCWSTLSGRWRRRLEKSPLFLRYPLVILRCLRTTLGWWVANLSCEVFAWWFPDQYQRMRYEDLVVSPREAIASILRGSSKLTSSASFEMKTGKNRHQLFGNEARHRALAVKDVRPDIRWKTDMPKVLYGIVSAVTWPLRLRYDY